MPPANPFANRTPGSQTGRASRVIDALLRPLEQIGLAGVALWLCLAHYGNVLLGRARLDLPALAAALRQSGLSVLPALTLVSLAVGLILGRQTAGVLADLNLPGVLLVTITYAVVTELIPLLVGILVAGRAGVALAARQATLIATGQMDGLLVSGVNPIQYTLAPVLLAMLVMSLAFAVWGSLVTCASAFIWIFAAADVPAALVLDAPGSSPGSSPGRSD